jgi:hypothetical protein
MEKERSLIEVRWEGEGVIWKCRWKIVMDRSEM